MKRKLWVLFATIVAAVALAFGISACSPFVQLPTQPQPLGTPVVSISDEGIASWEPVVHAVGYSYLIDDAAEVSTTARNVQLEDGQTIQVKATGDGSLYLDSAYSAPATYHKEPVPELTQLATPVVSIDEEGLATWEAVPNASGYQYKLNGGEEKTLESDAELQVQLQDKDSIQVKAVGDGETYSDSEYSEAKAYTAPVKPQIIKIETPVVTIDGDGTAHWEAVAHASAYFYKIDGEDEIRTTKTSTKLQDGQTISVKACTEEEGFEDSDYSEPVKYIAPVTPPQPTRLATPEVTIDEEGLATWAEVAHASGYKYKISGGEETTLVGAELQVQLEDKQYIEVKAVGDGETYSDSPYSAAKTYNAPAKPEPTQLATPEVTIDEDGLATWTEVAHASGYKYKISGGEEMTIESGAELQVQLEDKQYIEVKAVGDGETYSDSPYSAAKTYNAPAKPEPTRLATPEVTINEEGLATWERVENATGYVCKVGGEEQEVQTELSIQLQSGDTLQVKAVSTDTEHFTESAYSDLQTYTKQPVEEKEKLLATFTLGKDTDQTETKDGSDNTKADGDTISSESYEEGPVNGYTLKITASVKDPDERLFLNAWDNKGNGCLKLGGGSGKTGKITVEVPAGVTKVIFYIAGYKSNNAVIKINGSTETITITTHSADGSYTQVVAEVPESRKVTLETSGSKTSRCKINTIEFWGEAVPELTKLDAPTLNVDSHTGDVTWEKVAGATSYTYTIDGENETTVGKDDELKVTLKNNQTISVIAKGDGTTYADSDPATQKYVHEHAYKTENNGWENDSDEGHYKKCTYCQEETEKTGHTYENGVCTECQYAHTDHKYSEEKPGECTVCHLKHTEHTYKDRNGKCHTCFAEHTGDDHVLATKTSSTHHWTECEVCGAKTAEIAHTHNTYGSDETQHWSVCECGATVPDTTVQHSKNTTYTADPTNHWDVCVCGKEVPGTKTAHTHDHYDIQEETHQSVCACGAKFGEAEKHDSAGWGKDQNNHWTICSVCGGNEGEHTAHEFKAEGDASEETCECGMEKNHVHTLEWQSNETEHWQKCKYCTHVQDQEAHDYVNGVCSNENCRHEHGGETHKLTLHSNPTHHWNECDICHLKEGETAHSEFTWQLGTDDKEGKHQHICGVCKQVADEHDAQEGAWDHDGTDHWHKCAGADDCTLPFDAKTPHGDFAWESVDDTYHQQKCKCGYTTNKVNHGEAYQWKETEDGSQHYQHCETCGHDTEKAAHSYEEKDYIADGDTGHYRVCECGHHEETEGHNYNKETGDGICTKCEHAHEGHAYNKEAKDGKCKTCGKLHVHTETLEWTKTDDTHKQYCTECGFETVPEDAHDYTKQSGSCDVCEQPHANHVYDPETHKCECGAIDPDVAKAEEALNAITFTTTEYYETMSASALPTTTLNSATVTWEVKAEQLEGYVQIEDNKLTILKLSTTGDVNVTITVKVTVGAITKEKDYTLKLYQTTVHEGTADDPFSIADAQLLLNRLKSGDYYKNETKTYIKGFVTDIGTLRSQSGRQHVYIGATAETSKTESIEIYSLNWDENGVWPTNSTLTVGDEVVVWGYLQNYGGTKEIGQNKAQNDWPSLTYWLKASERPENILNSDDADTFFEYYSTEETLAEGGGSLELEFAMFNAPAGMVFTLTSSDKAVTVEGYTLTAVGMPEGGKVTITVKATYKGVEAERTFDITVTPFNYADHLSNALESIKKSIPESILQGATSGEIKLAPKYSDVTLTITGGDAATIEVKMTSEGVYTLTAAQDASIAAPVEFTIILTYNGEYTGKGQTKTETVSVTILSADNPESHILTAKEKLTAALAEAIPENKLEKEYYEITLPTIENIKFALNDVVCDKIVGAKLVETEEGNVLTFEVIKAETEYPNVTFTFDVTYTKGETTSQNADFYFTISALKTVETPAKMIIIPGTTDNVEKNEYAINLPIGTSYDNTTKLEHSANGITFETNKVQGANDGGQIIRFQKGTGFVQNTTQMPGNIKSIELVGLTSGTFKISLGTTKDCTDLIDQAFDAQNKYTTEETNYRFFKLTCTNSAQGIIQSFTINYATSVTEVSGRDKITAALAALEKVDDITEANAEGVALPASTVEDVTFTWSTAEPDAAYQVKDNKLIVPELPQKNGTITLIVTAECGTAKPQQKQFTINVTGKETVAKQKIAEALKEFESYTLADITQAGDVTLKLPQTQGVEAEWKSDNETYKVENKNTLKVDALPDVETPVELTLTISCEPATADSSTKITVKIMPEGSKQEEEKTITLSLSTLSFGGSGYSKWGTGKTVGGIQFNGYDSGEQSSNWQFRTSSGSVYNVDSLGIRIAKIEIVFVSSSGTIKLGLGTSSMATVTLDNNNSTSITMNGTVTAYENKGEDNYTFFKLSGASTTAKITSIKITYFTEA